MAKLIKATYIIALAYLVGYMTILANYILLDRAKVTDVIHTAFDLQWYLPLIIMLPFMHNKILSLVNKIANLKIINTGYILIIFACIFLHFLHVPGWWWTWTTIGLLASIIVLITNILATKIKTGEAALLSLGIAFVFMGTWEIVYQTGLLMYHSDLAFGRYGFQSYIQVVLKNILWALQGLAITFFVLYRNRKTIKVSFNNASKISFAIYIILTAYWFLSGMPTVWKTPEFSFMMLVIRATKVFYALGIIAMFMQLKNTCNTPGFYDRQVKSRNPIRAWFHRSRYGIMQTKLVCCSNPVVDLGCGDVMWNNKARFTHVIGVDNDEKTLDALLAKQRISHKIVADINKQIPLQSNSISTVVCTEVLEHLWNYPQTIREIYRILKPGGKLIASVPYDVNLSLWKPLFAVQCFIQGDILGEVYYKNKCGHINHFNTEKIKAEIEKQGLIVLSTEIYKGMTIYIEAVK